MEIWEWDLISMNVGDNENMVSGSYNIMLSDTNPHIACVYKHFVASCEDITSEVFR